MANEKLTVDDVKNLVDLVGKVQDKGHFASIEYMNHGYEVIVAFQRGGFQKGGYDLFECFDLTNKDEDINKYHKVVLCFASILEEG